MPVLQVESSSLASHIVDRLDKHLDVICTRVSAVERTLHGTQGSHAATSSAERSVRERLSDIEANVRALGEASGGRAGDAAASAPAAAAASGGGGGDVQSILVSTSEKMTIYEGVITVLNREVEKLSTQVCIHVYMMSVSSVVIVDVHMLATSHTVKTVLN